MHKLTRNTHSCFWQVGEVQAPDNTQHRKNLSLAPVRVVQHQNKRACLVVDARWLLLYFSICGEVPCQSTRFTMAARWTQYFMQRCVPDRLWCSSKLFTGLPNAAASNPSLMAPSHRPSGRKLFLRPTICDTLGWKSQVCPTGVPEDMCSAWPRYHLARLLDVEEGVLPAACVTYSFAPDTCVPVALLEGPLPTTMLLQQVPFGLLHFTKQGEFRLLRDNQERDITASSDGLGLRGRVRLHVRPLLEMDRPGIALLTPATNEVDTITAFDANEGYELFLHGTHLHPLLAERCVQPIGTILYLHERGAARAVMLTLPDEAPLRDGELPVRLAVDQEGYEKRTVHVSVRRLKASLAADDVPSYALH